jgi:hypothetical protein
MAQLSYYPGICLERLMKTTKGLSQYSLCPRTSRKQVSSVVFTLLITDAICCNMQNDRTTTPPEGLYIAYPYLQYLSLSFHFLIIMRQYQFAGAGHSGRDGCECECSKFRVPRAKGQLSFPGRSLQLPIDP